MKNASLKGVLDQYNLFLHLSREPSSTTVVVAEDPSPPHQTDPTPGGQDEEVVTSDMHSSTCARPLTTLAQPDI